MRRRRIGTLFVALLALLFTHLTHAALASFTDRTSSSMSVSTGSLAAPTGVTAVPGCVVLTPRVTVSWTASASTITTGYRILRSSGGGLFTQIGSVEGRTATAFTDTLVTAGTTYAYTVQSVYRSWTATSTQVTAKVPLLCI